MIDNLDMFQNLVDNGSIGPTSLNMNTAEQLNNFNVWLAQLTDSLDSEQQQQQQSYDYVQPANTSYADMLLQFNSPTNNINNNDLYPTNVEEDMYVRSQPIMHHQQQQQTVDYNPSTPTKLYGEFNMPPMVDNLNQFGYPSNISDVVPQMNGMRHHYSNVPGIVSNSGFFTPDLRTTQNLGSSKDDIKYKKNPINGQEKEEKATEAFKPIKPTFHESKKNVTTMMNVFASVDGANNNKKSATSIDETKQSLAKKSAVSKNILDLLVSDMSDLAIEKRRKDDDEDSLYPDSPSTKKSSKEAVEKHRKLLKQLSQWVNQNYSEKKEPVQHINSSSSVQVQ